MTNFEFTKYANNETQSSLRQLLDCPQDDFMTYRKIMHELGAHLGAALALEITKLERKPEIVLACTVEDADFLAAGLLEALQKHADNAIRLACYWNKSTYSPYGIEDFEIAPILRSYEEPTMSKDCILVIVKAAVSGVCVVSTNLTRLVSHLDPPKIFICAPVMLVGAEDRLSANFDTEMVARFEFITFRTDNKKEGSNIVPGIGGNVYERYGFVNETQKNRITPEIVKTRREMIPG